MLGTAGAYGYRSYYGHPEPDAAAAGDHRRQLDADQDRPRRRRAIRNRTSSFRIGWRTPARTSSWSRSRRSRSRSRSWERQPLRAWCFRRRSRRLQADRRPAPAAAPLRHAAGRHRPSPSRSARSPFAPTEPTRAAGRWRAAAAGPQSPRRPCATDYAAGPAGDGAARAVAQRQRTALARAAGAAGEPARRRQPAARARRRRRRAARDAPTTSSAGGFVVQLSSQTSESDAQSLVPQPAGQVPERARRTGSRSFGAPISAAKGVYYRTNGRAVRIGAGSEPVLRELQGRRRPVRRSERTEPRRLTLCGRRGLIRADDGTRFHHRHCGHDA